MMFTSLQYLSWLQYNIQPSIWTHNCTVVNNRITIITVSDIDQSRFQTFVFTTKTLIRRLLGTVVKWSVFENILVHWQAFVHKQITRFHLKPIVNIKMCVIIFVLISCFVPATHFVDSSKLSENAATLNSQCTSKSWTVLLRGRQTIISQVVRYSKFYWHFKKKMNTNLK